MGPSNKFRGIIGFTAIIVTIFVLGSYVKYNKPNAYRVYMNGKSVAYVKNKDEFYNAQTSVQKDILKRSKDISFLDKVSFEEVNIDIKKLTDNSKLKNIIIENSEDNLSALIMKSDGKKIATLASESEIRQTLDNVKSTYLKSDRNGVFKLKNNITYEKQKVKLKDIDTIDDGTKNALENKNSSLISFYKIEDGNKGKNIKLSRSASISSFMNIPSTGNITSEFGERWGRRHDGLDIGAPMGAPITAAMDGKVIFAGWQDGYGKVIKIDHEENIQTTYAHCNNILIDVGSNVKRGEKIGEVGSTGRSTGPHVHFEVRVRGIPQNPLQYLK